MGSTTASARTATIISSTRRTRRSAAVGIGSFGGRGIWTGALGDKTGWRALRIQRSLVIVRRKSTGLKGRKGGQTVGGGGRGSGRILGGSSRIGGRGPQFVARRGVLAIVEVLAAHLCIFGDATFSRLAADEGATHGAGHDAAGGQQDGGPEDDPSAPLEMRHEEQDVNQEGEQ